MMVVVGSGAGVQTVTAPPSIPPPQALKTRTIRVAVNKLSSLTNEARSPMLEGVVGACPWKVAAAGAEAVPGRAG